MSKRDSSESPFGLYLRYAQDCGYNFMGAARQAAQEIRVRDPLLPEGPLVELLQEFFVAARAYENENSRRKQAGNPDDLPLAEFDGGRFNILVSDVRRYLNRAEQYETHGSGHTTALSILHDAQMGNLPAGTLCSLLEAVFLDVTYDARSKRTGIPSLSISKDHERVAGVLQLAYPFDREERSVDETLLMLRDYLERFQDVVDLLYTTWIAAGKAQASIHVLRESHAPQDKDVLVAYTQAQKTLADYFLSCRADFCAAQQRKMRERPAYVELQHSTQSLIDKGASLYANRRNRTTLVEYFVFTADTLVAQIRAHERLDRPYAEQERVFLKSLLELFRTGALAPLYTATSLLALKQSLAQQTLPVLESPQGIALPRVDRRLNDFSAQLANSDFAVRMRSVRAPEPVQVQQPAHDLTALLLAEVQALRAEKVASVPSPDMTAVLAEMQRLREQLASGTAASPSPTPPKESASDTSMKSQLERIVSNPRTQDARTLMSLVKSQKEAVERIGRERKWPRPANKLRTLIQTNKLSEVAGYFLPYLE